MAAHRFGGGHHVREKHLPAGELLADRVHTGDVSVIDGIDWGDASSQCLLGER